MSKQYYIATVNPVLTRDIDRINVWTPYEDDDEILAALVAAKLRGIHISPTSILYIFNPETYHSKFERSYTIEEFLERFK